MYAWASAHCLTDICLQGKEPPWLRQEIPEQFWQHEKSIVLLTGRLDGPNPTHQASFTPEAPAMQVLPRTAQIIEVLKLSARAQVNIHFYAVWKWMKQLRIKPGQLRMLVDFHVPQWAPGTFGTGLASALGTVRWLPLLDPGALILDHVQFSIPRGHAFIFNIFKYQLDRQIDLDFIEFAETVKQVHQPITPKLYNSEQDLDPDAIKRAPRVVISKRRPADSRILANAEELANFLRTNHKMDATVACFGELAFPDQVSIASHADVLVGVTGSDLINLMFLPLHGSIVEIFPAHNGESVFTPELYNMARMLGKNHLSYVSVGNVTVSLDESSAQLGGKLLHSAKSISVSVPDVAALIQVAARQALGGSVWGRTSCRKHQENITCTSDDIDTFTRDATAG